jgi:hypothetical protein
VTYMAMADRAVSELPQRQSAGPRRYTSTRAPPEKHPVRCWHPRTASCRPRCCGRLAGSYVSRRPTRGSPTILLGRQHLRLNRIECVHSAGPVPAEQLHCNFVVDTSTGSLYFHRMLAVS